MLLSDFDTIQGIPVEANQPLGCKEPQINLMRPAVLRVYYGVSKRCTESLNIIRPTYGPISSSSSVGMDPYNFTTKAMSLYLYNISQTLRTVIISKFPHEECPPLEDQFNHCTVLIYSGKIIMACLIRHYPFIQTVPLIIKVHTSQVVTHRRKTHVLRYSLLEIVAYFILRRER